MLNGQLLAESSPKQLLTTYACDQLEKVFLKLCIERTIDTNKDASSLKSVVRVTHHPSVDKSSEKETYDKGTRSLRIIYIAVLSV